MNLTDYALGLVSGLSVGSLVGWIAGATMAKAAVRSVAAKEAAALKLVADKGREFALREVNKGSLFERGKGRDL